MDTTTDRDDQHDLSETAWKARTMALPLVAWQDGLYRIVLWYDEDSDEIHRTPEHLTGHDLLGNERWEALDDASTWSDQHGDLVISMQWKHLAHQLAVTAAPWPTAVPAPTPDDVRNALQTEYARAIITMGQNRNKSAQSVENASAVALVLEALAETLHLPLDEQLTGARTRRTEHLAGERTGPAAGDHLFEAYIALCHAYERSDSNALDGHIQTAQEALEAAAMALGLDPLKDRVSDALIDADEES